MPTDKWSYEEVEMAVEAYMALFEQITNEGNILKQPVFRELSDKHGRSVAAFNYRFRNISYVLSRMGLPTLPNFSFGSYKGGTDETIIKQILEAKGYFIGIKPIPPVPIGKQRPVRKTTTVESFVRDPAVKAWVLNAADGYCENCNQPAPFEQVDGVPFLEVHHVKPLAAGGSDTVTNAVAICPNCHRRFHYGADAVQLAVRIVKRIKRLRVE